MATMIPPVVPRDYKSAGELEVFRRLVSDKGTDGWIVLHSLGLARHEHRVAGEVDFVVIMPGRGVMCLEVKGASNAHLRRDVNGLWFFGPCDKGEARSPFAQAAEAMHSLRSQLLSAHADLRGVQFSFAAVFPYARFAERSPEWNEWEVIDSIKLRDGPISRWLGSSMDRARHHLLSAREHPRLVDGSPTPEQCQEIRDALRGSFEIPVDRRARADALDAELRQYTDEQFLALDAMAGNPRTIFNGPAGTGKTLLAIEAAARSRAHNRRVLLCCYNRLLGQWLERQTESLSPEVVTGTLHKQMLRVSGLAGVPADAGPDFWQNRLPDLACERLLELSSTDDSRFLFDELVIDEGQDLMHQQYLDFLDLSVRGGWASGGWRLFGDFDRATVYDQSDVILQEFHARNAGGAPIYSLHINCRNTPRTAEWVHLLAGLRPRYQRVLRPDDQVSPEIRFYKNTNEQELLLADTLQKLDGLGFRGKDIVVLSARGDCQCARQFSVAPWRDRFAPFEHAGNGRIGWCTARSFKGLEAAAIIVTDVETIDDQDARDLFYVGITRALQRLIILAHERVKEQALEAITGKGEG